MAAATTAQCRDQLVRKTVAAAAEGSPDVTLLTTGGGTFEAQICP
jgi:hypothetical protein